MTTQFTIAYRCAQCGKIELREISIFEISRKRSRTIECLCGYQAFSIFTNDYKQFRISIYCVICSIPHIYYFHVKEISKVEPKILYCGNYQLELCFIGQRDRVEESIDSYEQNLEKLMDELEYDYCFANSEIMMECFNIVHDLAEKHHVICDCGMNYVDITLLSDCIEIRCIHCKNTYIIPAKERKDLEELKEIPGIRIMKNKSSL